MFIWARTRPPPPPPDIRSGFLHLVTSSRPPHHPLFIADDEDELEGSAVKADRDRILADLSIGEYRNAKTAYLSGLGLHKCPVEISSMKSVVKLVITGNVLKYLPGIIGDLNTSP